MPAYVTAPPAITPRRGLQEGIPGYSAGIGPAIYGQADSRFLITSVTANGATAVITGALVEGPVPPVGGLISIRGTSALGGAFNVSNIAITAVALNANGVGTISFALAQTIGATADAGQAIIPPLETFENFLAPTKFLQFAVPVAASLSGGGRRIIMQWRTVTTATLAIQMEEAIDDIDAAYTLVGASQVTLAGSFAGIVTGRFVRVNGTAQTGNGTLIAKLLIA
jgi:hypothetical protein